MGILRFHVEAIDKGGDNVRPDVHEIALGTVTTLEEVLEMPCGLTVTVIPFWKHKCRC